MGTFSESYLKQQSRKILSAIKHLHKNGLIHQDIKPKNVIVNPFKNGDLSLIYFGLARLYNKVCPSDRTFACTGGTLDYAPPEFAKDHGQRVWGPEIDVHCFGAMLFYVLWR